MNHDIFDHLLRVSSSSDALLIRCLSCSGFGCCLGSQISGGGLSFAGIVAVAFVGSYLGCWGGWKADF